MVAILSRPRKSAQAAAAASARAAAARTLIASITPEGIILPVFLSRRPKTTHRATATMAPSHSPATDERDHTHATTRSAALAAPAISEGFEPAFAYPITPPPSISAA